MSARPPLRVTTLPPIKLTVPLPVPLASARNATLPVPVAVIAWLTARSLPELKEILPLAATPDAMPTVPTFSAVLLIRLNPTRGLSALPPATVPMWLSAWVNVKVLAPVKARPPAVMACDCVTSPTAVSCKVLVAAVPRLIPLVVVLTPAPTASEVMAPISKAPPE